jgi:hypothetical protein
MSSTTSAESGANIRSRKDRPCDACRRRKSRCVINEGQTSCVLCQFHTQDCTFVQSPQPRKRKLNTEGKEESVAKRRHADSFFSLQNSRPLSCDHCLLIKCSTMTNFATTDLQTERMRDEEDLLNRVFRVLERQVHWLRIWQILEDQHC